MQEAQWEVVGFEVRPCSIQSENGEHGADVRSEAAPEGQDGAVSFDLHGQVTAHYFAIRRGRHEKPGHRATISC